jgi:hypothetical protein
MKPRFTIDGSDELEARLAATCNKVLAGLESSIPAPKLEAVLLGGGYGRGEGGVLQTEAGDRPYNDLEFYVCLRGNRWWNETDFGPVLHALSEELSPAAELDVEFKLFSLDQLRCSPVNMFYYDLVMGHQWLLGEESFLRGCEHQREAGQIPLSEATRLLMNRSSGLLFARHHLMQKPFTPAHADFTGRNLAKAQLAFGDVVLAAHGQYHWSVRERHARLKKLSTPQELPWLPVVQRHHAAGLEFKLHPRKTAASASDLESQHSELVSLGLKLWLWLENRRLHQSFASARDYASSPEDKCPETKGWRNRLIHLRTFGPTQLLTGKWARYPRERLFHALALLLWEPAALHEPPLVRQLHRELNTRAADFEGLVRAYEKLWRRFH